MIKFKYPNLKKIYNKHEITIDILGMVIVILIIVSFSIFLVLPRKQYPNWLKNKEEKRVDFLINKMAYFTKAAEFYIENDTNKTQLYIDSAKSVKREIDSLNIFSIKKD